MIFVKTLKRVLNEVLDEREASEVATLRAQNAELLQRAERAERLATVKLTERVREAVKDLLGEVEHDTDDKHDRRR